MKYIFYGSCNNSTTTYYSFCVHINIFVLLLLHNYFFYFRIYVTVNNFYNMFTDFDLDYNIGCRRKRRLCPQEFTLHEYISSLAHILKYYYYVCDLKRLAPTLLSILLQIPILPNTRNRRLVGDTTMVN